MGSVLKEGRFPGGNERLWQKAMRTPQGPGYPPKNANGVNIFERLNSLIFILINPELTNYMRFLTL